MIVFVLWQTEKKIMIFFCVHTNLCKKTCCHYWDAYTLQANQENDTHYEAGV